MKKKFAVIFALLLLIFITNRIFFFRPSFLEQWSANITYPFIWCASTITTPIKNLMHRRQTYNELLSYVHQLAKERDQLWQENVELKASIKYDAANSELREFRQRYALDNAIVATVLIKNFCDEHHFFVLNRGRQHGVKRNMVAIYKQQLVGRVTHVFRSWCKITLITDSNSKIAAHTFEANAPGIAQGAHEKNKCHLHYVSHLKSVREGDLVLSSGQGLVYPQGFALGTIEHHEKDGVCHQITLKPLFDLTKLNVCLLTDQSKMNLF